MIHRNIYLDGSEPGLSAASESGQQCCCCMQSFHAKGSGKHGRRVYFLFYFQSCRPQGHKKKSKEMMGLVILKQKHKATTKKGFFFPSLQREKMATDSVTDSQGEEITS